MAQILKGSLVAEAINEASKADVDTLRAHGIIPTLAILRVGERPDDIAYERSAAKRCAAVGVEVRNVILPSGTSQAELMEELERLNRDDSVHGIIYFRPLPALLDDEAVRCALDPEKDVDGVTDTSLAGVFSGSGKGFAPCTAQACIEILDHFGITISGKRASVIGRSLVVGKPAAMLLTNRNATVTICHTKTQSAPEIVRHADIVVVAAGKMEAIGAEYFSPGQVVVDVGINWNEEKGKLCGDVVFDEVQDIVSAITPVPGGVGAVTTSVLVSHVVEAAKRRLI